MRHSKYQQAFEHHHTENGEPFTRKSQYFSILLVFALAAVTGLAFAVPAQAVIAEDACEEDVCNLDSNDCEPAAGVKYNCKEIVGTPGCQSTSCAEH